MKNEKFAKVGDNWKSIEKTPPRNERRHGLQVPTARVPVPPALLVVVEVVHFDVTGLDAVVVDDDHAVDRTDEARKHVDRAVDHFG